MFAMLKNTSESWWSGGRVGRRGKKNLCPASPSFPVADILEQSSQIQFAANTAKMGGGGFGAA